MLTAETLLAAVGSAALTIAVLRTVGSLLTYRRTTPAWLRRRLGLEVRS